MNLKIQKLKVEISYNKKEIISDASFDIAKGQIFLITGPNGSGKSSLLSAIFKHPQYSVSAGEIVLEKEDSKVDILNLKTFEIAQNGLYLAMQHVPEIEGVNLLQFLYRSYKNIYKESEKSVLDFNSELKSFCERYEIDQNFLKRDLNVGLSGGEKKQAEMLHLFALKPKFVFMDEPDSGVDKEAIKKVFKIISDFQKEYEMSFCIVSHHPTINEYIKVDKTMEVKDGILI